MLGGGAGGLLTALVVAGDGHAVTVLERNDAPAPDSDDSAWAHWERRGVPQFRQPHGLTARFRNVLAAEVPTVAAELQSLAPVYDLASTAPDPSVVTAADREIAMTMVRRPTLERLLAIAADQHERIEVRRGVAATGLETGTPVSGRTNVIGVRTEHGDPVVGDLVVDCSGRRSPVGGWLTDLGLPVEESGESDGFTYASRWFRRDAELPPMRAGTFGGLGPGLAALIFPADDNTFAIAMVGSAHDSTFRRVQRPEPFMRLAERFPLLEEWIEPGTYEPISDIFPMGSIQNRHLRLRRDGGSGPVGVVNTSDSFASTNPSLGRGLGITADLAIRLRSLLSSEPGAEDLVDEWDDIQQRFHRPWLDDSIAADANLRAGFEAMLAGRPPEPPHPWRAALGRAAAVDTDCWRAFTEVNQILATPTRWSEDRELLDRAGAIAADVAPPTPVMSRADLDSITA